MVRVENNDYASKRGHKVVYQYNMQAILINKIIFYKSQHLHTSDWTWSLKYSDHGLKNHAGVFKTKSLYTKSCHLNKYKKKITQYMRKYKSQVKGLYI